MKMVNENELERIKEEVSTAIKLIKESHAGADLKEARRLLGDAGEAVKNDRVGQALSLAEKARLTAKPTTDYLLDRAKKQDSEGSGAYKKQDFQTAIKLWKKSLDMYARVLELAGERKEKETIEGVKQTIADIEEEIKTARMEKTNREMAALVEDANKIVDEAKEKFEAGEFDAAKEKFESAKELYAKSAGIADEFGFDDGARLKETVKEMETSIKACLLDKGESLIEKASREKGKKKEDAFLDAIRHLESFSSDNTRHKELNRDAYRGQVEGRIEIGTGLMEDAEKLFKTKEYYKAKEGYRKAQDHFENLSDFTVEHRLEEEKREVDSLIDACTANVRACTDAMLGREKVAKGEVIKAGDMRKGIKIKPAIKIRKPAPIYSFPEELSKYYEAPEDFAEGGTSWVYKARRKKDGLTVAIKIAKYWNRRISRNFMDEVSIWKRLNHPNITKIYDYAASPRGYIEMEFIENSLEKLVKPIDPQKAAYLIFKIADGLKYAHRRAKPVYHLDLKPGNVLLANDEEPKIVDWGLSKVKSSSNPSKGLARGYTTLYAAPEQILNKKVDARTDVFQLGQIFHELVTGRAPFEADNEHAIAEKIKNVPPAWPSDINSDAELVKPIIVRCLKKEKEKRYQSVEELQRELADVLGIKPEQQVKITGHRKDRIIAYTELIEKCSRRDEKNECILWLNSLKAVVKSTKVKALIEEVIGRIELHIKEDVEIEEMLPAIDEIIHKARMEG